MMTGFLTSDLKKCQLTLLDLPKSKLVSYIMYGLDAIIDGQRPVGWGNGKRSLDEDYLYYCVGRTNVGAHSSEERGY